MRLKVGVSVLSHDNLVCNCRNKERVAAREKHRGENKNRWEVLRSRVIRCGVEHVAYPIKGNAQQEKKCWGCGEVEHCLWTCSKKAARLLKGNAQQKVVGRTEEEKMMKEVKCVGCERKGMNTVFIPESIAREKMCPACEEGERRINMAYPSKEKV